jgi:hypothetical protein
VAVPAGYIGEVKEIVLTSGGIITGSNTVGIYTDILSLSLAPGAWCLHVVCPVYIGSGNGIGINARAVLVALTDSSNNILKQSLGPCTNAAMQVGTGSVTLEHSVSISASTTYKLRFSSVEMNTVTTIGAMYCISGNGVETAAIIATRIA